MSRNTTRFETAVETFADYMTDAEAEAYVLREVDGINRQAAADQLDKDPSTLDTLHQRAKQKARLPEVSKIETHARVGEDRDHAVVIWFDNGAKLRYRATDDTVYEETFHTDDPDSVHDSYDVAIDPADLEEAALESLAEYINSYRDPDACRTDWPHVYEAITLYSA